MGAKTLFAMALDGGSKLATQKTTCQFWRVVFLIGGQRGVVKVDKERDIWYTCGVTNVQM